MEEEKDFNIDNKKFLEKISKLESVSQEISNLLNDMKNNDELVSNNKEIIKYLYENQYIKDTDFYLLFPNMNIINKEKNGVFHKLQRKNCIQYIQDLISGGIKNKEIINSKLNEAKKKLIDNIEDPSQMDILNKEIFDLMLPLATKKFPNNFKTIIEEENEDDD